MKKPDDIPDTLKVTLLLGNLNDRLEPDSCCINHDDYIGDCENCNITYRALNTISNRSYTIGYNAGYSEKAKYIRHLEDTIESLSKRKHYWRTQTQLKEHQMQAYIGKKYCIKCRMYCDESHFKECK